MKRDPKPVDFDVFTDEQKVAVDQIIDYIEGKTEFRMMCLKGFAGTGKTFTVGMLQDWLLYAKKMKTAVSAPTNKAVQVLKDMCDIVSNQLTFSTIHKLLGLKESYDYNGRLSFVPDPMNPPSLTAFDVLFIDEASMFDDSLFKLVNPFVEEGVKIIFIGDPAQIPPINRLDCIPFIRKKQLEFKIGVCELTTILRQANDNPLLKFATQIREQRTSDAFQYDYDIDTVNGMGIIPIKKEAKDVIYRICDSYFANPIFADYPDFMKVIAWRNRTVNAINAKIRQFIFKAEQLPLVLPTEKMIADEPIRVADKPIMTTNTEFEVIEAVLKETDYRAIVRDHVVVHGDFKYYDTLVEHMSEKGPKRNRIMILHEDSFINYQTAMDTLKIYALSQHGFTRSDAWKAYYKFWNFFAKVKYNYAITAHKAQGSSYENTMMIEWDMYENTRYEERNRIRYVAATRARKYLFIVR